MKSHPGKTAARCLLAFLLLTDLSGSGLARSGQYHLTIGEAMKNVRTIRLEAVPKPVEETVASSIKETFAPGARIVSGAVSGDGHGVFRVHVVDGEEAGTFFRISPDGTGEISATRQNLLYFAFCRVRDDWRGADCSDHASGVHETITHPWLEGDDGLLAAPALAWKDYDPESTVRELARLGCSHLTVNALATRAPYEEGPPGEIYYRFYSASPDLDQFVATDLNAGIYPPEYLEANFNLLKRNAALAVKYGLTPGLTICSPRSVPEALLEKYPYLRGARVDHPYRSYRPRYTLTLSHPVVRWHYAEMLRKIVQAVPELGFLYLWTNDSGSGFEYVSTLYAGRNGGAYLIREWKTNEEILKSAAANVVRYLRLLRDAASVIHPGFRVVANAPSFGAEADSILDAIDSRIDMAVSPAEFTGSRRAEKYRQLSSKGSRLFGSTRISGNYIVGVPFPWLCFDRLRETALPGIGELSVVVDPPSLSPFDINREVVRMFQTETDGNTDSLVAGMAERWVGASRAPRLAGAWRDADSACRAFPDVPLYGNAWAFPWYRLWVRPFVPDIEKIPSNERAYYEEYMIATFNNPALVDFEIDALWDLIPPAQASEIVAQCDRNVWRTLDRAIATLHDGATAPGSEESAVRVFTDQYDRLVALRCYFRTLRNVAAWIADVHGYLGSARDAEKQVWLQRTRAMLRDETENTKALLELWKRSHTQFMPLSTVGETWSAYGDNFGKLLERKIALMEAHRNDLPFVDGNFMWRLTPGSRVDLQTYIHY